MGSSFEALGVEHSRLRSIREMGFDETFPIQAEAIAPLLEGKDVLGQAHTGAGKTLAYTLPVLQRLDPHAFGIRGLVVVPTRELAVRVAGEFEKLGRHLHVRTVAVYGGQSKWSSSITGPLVRLQRSTARDSVLPEFFKLAN